MVTEASPRPSPARGILRRMSHSFTAAGAVSLGVQEWPTDTRRGSSSSLSSLSSSPSEHSSPASPSSPPKTSLRDFARWQRAPSPPATKPTTTRAPLRKDSLHTQEQECVMDMACLI